MNLPFSTWDHAHSMKASTPHHLKLKIVDSPKFACLWPCVSRTTLSGATAQYHWLAVCYPFLQLVFLPIKKLINIYQCQNTNCSIRKPGIFLSLILYRMVLCFIGSSLGIGTGFIAFSLTAWLFHWGEWKKFCLIQVMAVWWSGLDEVFPVDNLVV